MAAILAGTVFVRVTERSDTISSETYPITVLLNFSPVVWMSSARLARA